MEPEVLDEVEELTFRGTARSTHVDGRGVKPMRSSRRTGNYYNQLEQLYGTNELETVGSSLIARAHHEYQRMEDWKNRDKILDENKRKIILKV